MGDNSLSNSCVRPVFGDIGLSPQRAAILRKTYFLFACTALLTSAGGWAASGVKPWIEAFFSVPGLLVTLGFLVLAPRLALAVRPARACGLAVLLVASFISGFVMAPIAVRISAYAPRLVMHSSVILALVFLSVSALALMSRHTFRTGRTLIGALVVSVGGAAALNVSSGFEMPSLFAVAMIGAIAAVILVLSTADVLRAAEVLSPTAAALTLFAATLNILMALAKIGQRLTPRQAGNLRHQELS
jgi:FtsH-binding integral membrane protein